MLSSSERTTHFPWGELKETALRFIQPKIYSRSVRASATSIDKRDILSTARWKNYHGCEHLTKVMNSDNEDLPPETDSKLWNLVRMNTTPQMTDLKYATYTGDWELFRRARINTNTSHCRPSALQRYQVSEPLARGLLEQQDLEQYGRIFQRLQCRLCKRFGIGPGWLPECQERKRQV